MARAGSPHDVQEWLRERDTEDGILQVVMRPSAAAIVAHVLELYGLELVFANVAAELPTLAVVPAPEAIYPPAPNETG